MMIKLLTLIATRVANNTNSASDRKPPHMALTWDETVDLLKVVTAKDRRTIGEGDIHFWFAVARQADWPSLDFAIAAVVRFASDQPGAWLEPGHITAYWRDLKREAGGRFEGVAPTRENIDDPRAQQIANKEAAELNLHHFVQHFINPDQVIDPRLPDRRQQELHELRIKELGQQRRRLWSNEQ